MTSASTKRRHQRNAELVKEWWAVPVGQRVTVRRDNGEVLTTITESAPFILDGKHAMIRVDGIPGNTRLDRVRLGWNPAPVSGLASEVMREMMKPPGEEDYAAAYKRASGRAPASKDAEIERLRAAMVHAMDECEAEANQSGSMTTRNVLRGVAARLKSALEKK